MRALSVAVVAAFLLTGCAAPQANWRNAAVGLSVTSVTSTSAGFLVGGRRDGASAVVRVSANGTSPVALHPQEPYAQTASIVALAAGAQQLYGIGVDIGGAHANPRWSAWDGTPAELTSRPQPFFTFGGHDAGPLLGVAVLGSDPVIVGSRTTALGARAVFYSLSGTTWSAPASSPDPLTSTRQDEYGFTAFAVAGRFLVLVGDDLHLVDGVHQSPVAWVGRPGGPWTRVDLDTAGLDGSGLAHATDVACTGEQCWVTGWVRGHAVAWPLELADDGAARAGAPARLPGAPGAGVDPIGRVAIVGGRPVVAPNGLAATVQVGCTDGWRQYSAPGPITALAVSDSTVAAVSGQALWTWEVPGC